MNWAIAELGTLLIWTQCIKIRHMLITEYWTENRIWSTQPRSGQINSNLMNSNILFVILSFCHEMNHHLFWILRFITELEFAKVMLCFGHL